MAIRSRIADDVVAVVAVVVGVPLVVTLFLHNTLVSRLSMPTRPMRTVEANP
jgi:hypothetical protein